VRGGQRVLGDALKRLARGRQRRPAALAAGEHELLGVVLGGEDDERAAVELPRALGALHELPQPRAGLLDLAVGHLRLAGRTVLQRRRRRRAVLLEDQADAVGRDPLGGALIAAQVAGDVGSEQAVGELRRPRDYADKVTDPPRRSGPGLTSGTQQQLRVSA
jgi:hypothetical protein